MLKMAAKFYDVVENIDKSLGYMKEILTPILLYIPKVMEKNEKSDRKGKTRVLDPFMVVIYYKTNIYFLYNIGALEERYHHKQQWRRNVNHELHS